MSLETLKSSCGLMLRAKPDPLSVLLGSAMCDSVREAAIDALLARDQRCKRGSGFGSICGVEQGMGDPRPTRFESMYTVCTQYTAHKGI